MLRAFGALMTLILMCGWRMAFAVQQAPPPVDVAKPPAKAIKLAPGLFYKVLRPGKGQLATKQYIKSLSTAWTSVDGKTQLNATEEGVDVSDPQSLAAMVPGLARALRVTPIGEQRRWWISASQMRPGWADMVAGDYTLDIEVLAELDPLPPPKHVAKAPDDAQITASGVQYIVLHSNQQTLKPAAKPDGNDVVKVHYSGWTPDGKMFDSSVLRERPVEFPLNRVIKGWSEGVQLMSVGDKYRFWLPQHMAYGAKPRPGAPKGDLVFDIELFKITAQ